MRMSVFRSLILAHKRRIKVQNFMASMKLPNATQESFEKLFVKHDKTQSGWLDFQAVRKMLISVSDQPVPVIVAFMKECLGLVENNSNALISCSVFTEKMLLWEKHYKALSNRKVSDDLPLTAPWYIISPSSHRLAQWRCVVIAAELYCFVATPFRLSFYIGIEENAYMFDRFFALDLLADSILWANAFVVMRGAHGMHGTYSKSSMHGMHGHAYDGNACHTQILVTAFINSHSIVVYSVFKIAQFHFMSGGMVIDLVTLLPWDWLALMFEASPYTVACLRLTRMLRIQDSYKVLSAFHNSAKAHSNSLKILILATYLSVATHLFCCVWFGVFAERGNTSVESWWTRYIHFGTGQDSSLLARYMLSFYWVWTQVLGMNAGNITPTKATEFIFSMTVLFCHFICLSLIIGKVSDIVVQNDEQLVQTRKRLLTVEEFLLRSHLPTDLCDEIRLHFDREVSDQSSSEEFETLILSLRHSLRVLIAKHVSRKLLDEVCVCVCVCG